MGAIDSAIRKHWRASAGAAIAFAMALLLPVAAGAWSRSSLPHMPARESHFAAQEPVRPSDQGAQRGGPAASISVHEEPPWVMLARVVNFAILVGVLVYFLRSPIAAYLARRSTEIRSDLTKAAQTREEAARELALIDEKMKALPGEIEALKARGAQEVAAEEARLRQAAEADRERLLEQARREIDLQLRAAERELVKQAADLTVGLAADRIKRNITDDDQQRLVDRYLVQLPK